MTLAQLISAVCTKVQALEAADNTACQQFLTNRYELIYNSYMWKDSLTMVDLTVNPATNPDHACGIVSLPQQIERVVAMRTQHNSIRIHALEEYYKSDWNRFADISDLNGLVEFSILNPIWFTVRPSTPTFPNSSVPGSVLSLSSKNSDDNQIQVKVTWRDETDRYTITQNLPVTLTPVDDSGFIEVESVFFGGPLESTQLQVTLVNPTGAPVTLQTFNPNATLRSPAYQRVRLFSRPTNQVTLSVLGKKPFVNLDFQNEVPLIRNLDNCLIAFGLADMLERSRQYQKAQAKLQEAGALLKELAKLETLQAANNQRFMPETGYGDPFFSPSSQRGLWA
jgi:hypothetical protein